MATENPQYMKKGFWTGIGLIAPVAFAVFIGNNLSGYANALMNADDYEEYEEEASYSEFLIDHSKNIVVDSFKDQRDGDKVNILGSITNTGSTAIGSIKLEAEFFDDKGEFVYEQTDYVDKKLAPNESENFLIACGCKDKKFPEYKTVTVRVVAARNF